MKVIPNKPAGFQPFSILVETAGEANLLASLIGGCNGYVTEAFGVDDKVYNEFYSALSKQADAEQTLDISI